MTPKLVARIAHEVPQVHRTAAILGKVACHVRARRSPRGAAGGRLHCAQVAGFKLESLLTLIRHVSALIWQVACIKLESLPTPARIAALRKLWATELPPGGDCTILTCARPNMARGLP
jgi:hypothetical protein